MEAMDIDDSESPIPSHSTLLSYPGNKQFKSDISKRMELNANSTAVPDTANWGSVREAKQFSRQYAHAYFVRLLEMRKILKPIVEQEWDGFPLKPIAELCESSSVNETETSPKKTNGHSHNKWTNVDDPLSQGTSSSHEHEQHIALREDITVAIIGTLFKQQPEKPSILQDLVDEIELRSETDHSNSKKTNFVSDKDVLMMEDETTRVRLLPAEHIRNDFSIPGLVNGVVCAVKGKPNIHGQFEVYDIIWATPKPCVWPQVKNCNKSKMIFVSGLNLRHADINATQLGLLFEYLEGLAGSESEQEHGIGEISRVFFVGNSFAAIQQETSVTTTASTSSMSTNEKFVKIAEVSKKLDLLLSQVAKTMEVYVIPGKTDPAEPMYPQPPFHRCLFPTSTRYPNFHLLSNPTRLELNISNKKGSEQLLDVIFMDGEPVLDAMRFSNTTCPLEMSRKLLEWGHLCPTAPDTLALHPGIKKDVFVLNKAPNLMVIGNQQEFKTTQWNKTKIITLPSFSQSSKIGIFSADDFSCAPREFKILL